MHSINPRFPAIVLCIGLFGAVFFSIAGINDFPLTGDEARLCHLAQQPWTGLSWFKDTPYTGGAAALLLKPFTKIWPDPVIAVRKASLFLTVVIIGCLFLYGYSQEGIITATLVVLFFSTSTGMFVHRMFFEHFILLIFALLVAGCLRKMDQAVFYVPATFALVGVGCGISLYFLLFIFALVMAITISGNFPKVKLRLGAWSIAIVLMLAGILPVIISAFQMNDKTKELLITLLTNVPEVSEFLPQIWVSLCNISWFISDARPFAYGATPVSIKVSTFLLAILLANAWQIYQGRLFNFALIIIFISILSIIRPPQGLGERHFLIILPFLLLPLGCAFERIFQKWKILGVVLVLTIVGRNACLCLKDYIWRMENGRVAISAIQAVRSTLKKRNFELLLTNEENTTYVLRCFFPDKIIEQTNFGISPEKDVEIFVGKKGDFVNHLVERKDVFQVPITGGWHGNYLLNISRTCTSLKNN